MTDCKNCLHYEVCADVMKKELFIKEKMLKIANPICKCFLDKSKIIELPCKVGDKVYRPSNCLGVVQFVIISCSIYESEMFFTDDSENIIYLPDIGKTVFLTHEEADRALKERENNG